LLQELAYIAATRLSQNAFSFVQEFSELIDVGAIGAHRERSKALLDLQVIEKCREHTAIRFGRHTRSMRIIGPWAK
jgi:hypothetical protein